MRMAKSANPHTRRARAKFIFYEMLMLQQILWDCSEQRLIFFVFFVFLRHCSRLQHSSWKCFCSLSFSISFFRFTSVLLLSNTLIRYACLMLVRCCRSCFISTFVCALVLSHYRWHVFLLSWNSTRLLSYMARRKKVSAGYAMEN